MMGGKTLILTRSCLTARGICNFLQVILPSVEVEIYQVFSELINTKVKHLSVIFLQPDLLPTPHVYTMEKLRSTFPEIPVIAITTYSLPDILRPYFEEQILFADNEELVIQKMSKIFNQGNFTVDQPKKYDNQVISEREKEILRSVALGRTNKEISDELFISTHTVITHRKNITSKLGIRTIAGLTVYAILNGLISADEVND